MARKTKQMLEQEISELKFEIAELKSNFRSIRVEKDYWFVKYKRYNFLYNKEVLKEHKKHEKLKNYFEEREEKNLKELDEMEKKLAFVLEVTKEQEMKNELLNPYYTSGW
ncbi:MULTISPECIES: hypothetical protein [Bacillus cereus group]|uniref:hypothetical protein n=1 Tax=Bacillus cereus group TaxID=86661 RepID=UPI0008728522|nr:MULTISPECIES: hypothetical protein [Bacillus cereus group]OFC86839.1 hypothetical protein BTGOE3_19020 [Bacillus thuringiensis]PEB29399.1 hypothetical protein COO14_14605 [Bacillus toyonensis]PEC38388.1 hypothetical protein CON60_16620 [Bacillus toyonensis]PEP63899.1 hypothetical protein CN574_15610 [Bacillus toyonensis]